MLIDPTYCGWDTTSTLLLFSDNVFGNFIYYSHLLPVVCSLFLSAVLLWQNYREPTIRALAFMTVAFTLWSLSDLILWATANPAHTMFFWSIIIHFELLVYIGSLYFIYHFISHRGPSVKQELLILIAYLPIILLVHTSYNLEAFDYTNCNREASEGPLVSYAYLLELLMAVWIFGYGMLQARKQREKKRSIEIIVATIGTVLFLVSFSLGNIIGSLEINWELGQYGLFSLPVFIGFLTYLIVKYQSFNVKLFAAQALVAGIFILIISILFVREVQNIRIITSITALLTLLLGYLLIKSVRREIEQRQKVEELAGRLETANARLKVLDKMKSEFVSIASHQLRSPLTSIRGYASMLLEGSYGKLSVAASEAIARIQDSSRYMALSIEDYLNVSRIEAGNMKYELAEFNLKYELDKIVEEVRPAALKKGLLLRADAQCKGNCTVKADIGKVRQVLQNVIDNSIKYTPKGEIAVTIHDDLKNSKIYVTVKDTGVGMSKETQEEVFEKFIRAKNANQINVTGTGLGLFVAKKMIEEMGGRIWAESEGEGKGSSFHVELPLTGKK